MKLPNETVLILNNDEETEFRFSDFKQRAILASIYFIISVLGISGNVLVILAVCLSRRLRTVTNVFVVSLSVADMLTCIVLPFNAVSLLDSDLGSSMYSEWICKSVSLVLYICGGCSLYTLAAIAINRYVLITQPVKTYRGLYSSRKMVLMVAFTWSVPLLVALVPPLFGLGELGYAEKYGTCTHKTSNPLSHVYSILQAVLFYPGPMTIIIICYSRIFRHVKDHCQRMMTSQIENASISSKMSGKDPEATLDTSPRPKRSHTSRKQIDITKNLFCVVLAFVVCVSPFGVALMIPPSDPFIPWAAAILVFNSCVNPVIYATKHPHFKEVFCFMLHCQWTKIRSKHNFTRQNVVRRR